jgi:type VI protein secretion system component Hcp
MKTTKFFTILAMAFIMFMPSISSAQKDYLMVDFIPGNSENTYLQDWILGMSRGEGIMGKMELPIMGEKIPANESIVLSAEEFEDPTLSVTLAGEYKSALPQIQSYLRDKKKFPVKLALCNTKGEPEGMFLMTNAKISGFEENDDRLDLTFSFEQIKFTSIPSEFEFNQEIFLMVEGIEGDSKNKHFKGWIDCSNVTYDLAGIPTKMDLLSEDILEFKTTTLEGGQTKNQQFSITKWVDKSSPALLSYYRDKTVFSAKIAIVNNGGGSTFIYELEDAIITNISDTKVTSNCSLNFSELKFYVEKR